MNPPQVTKQEQQWAMFAHLSTLIAFLGLFLANIVAPLVIWQLKKNDMPFVAQEAKEALNFQITMSIAIALCIPLCFVFIGFLLIPLVAVWDMVFTIIAAVKAGEGVSYRYPLTIRFVH